MELVVVCILDCQRTASGEKLRSGFVKPAILEPERSRLVSWMHFVGVTSKKFICDRYISRRLKKYKHEDDLMFSCEPRERNR